MNERFLNQLHSTALDIIIGRDVALRGQVAGVTGDAFVGRWPLRK